MSTRFVRSLAPMSLSVAALIALTASPAMALKEFKDAFQEKYVKPKSTAASDVALASAVNEAGCAICHVGENKKNRNAYGKQLAKLISKRDKNNKDKIFKAMDTVAQMKSEPNIRAFQSSRPTFGEKISSGKLPAQD